MAMEQDSDQSGEASRLPPRRRNKRAKVVPLRRSLTWKTVIVSTAVVASNVIGNYMLSRGLHMVGALVTFLPGPYMHALANPWVTVGVVFMLMWLLTRLALLSWADLSYVLPVTSFAYVLSALLGKLLLGERVSMLRWGGIAAITLGVGLVALTYPHSPETDEVAQA